MKKARVDAIVKAKAREAEIRGRVEGRKEAERKYEMLILPPQDGSGVCVIGEVPKHMTFRVALGPMYAPRIFDPSKMPRFDMEAQQLATFIAVQKCQSFGNGQRVVWYEYQFRGL